MFELLPAVHAWPARIIYLAHKPNSRDVHKLGIGWLNGLDDDKLLSDLLFPKCFSVDQHTREKNLNRSSLENRFRLLSQKG